MTVFALSAQNALTLMFDAVRWGQTLCKRATFGRNKLKYRTRPAPLFMSL